MFFKKQYIFLFFAFIILTDCKSAGYNKYSDKKYSMGTLLEIILFSDNKKEAKKILNECFELADTLEKKVSAKIDSSTIGMLNKQKEYLVEDDFILGLIKESVKYSSATRGAFDPSLYHLIDIWGFEHGNYKVPTKDGISNALSMCGYKNIFMDNNRVVLKNKVSLDLGGIAKGKIIDELAKYLRSKGVEDFLINGGGDIVVNGKYKGERLWKIAVVDPFDKNNFFGMIDLSDFSIVTSGDYERNFTGTDGKFYHHILDPKTGYPTENDIHSVTVISDSPAKADAYATALYVMGKDAAIDFDKKYDDIKVIIVSGSNEKDISVYVSDGIEVEQDASGFYNFKF